MNIEHYIDTEYEQEKLLEAINVLKYYENALDKKIRLAREDEAKKVADEVSENIARNLLRSNQDIEYVHGITDLPISRLKELKANL